MLYLNNMEKDDRRYLAWAQFLQHNHLQNPVSLLLEAAGPMTTFLAQVIHFSTPLFSRTTEDSGWRTLARMLENEEDTQLFIHYLREEQE